jgi:hypothetical protein
MYRDETAIEAKRNTINELGEAMGWYVQLKNLLGKLPFCH